MGRCAPTLRLTRRSPHDREDCTLVAWYPFLLRTSRAAAAIAPGAVIAEVARRHDLAPQQLSNWIRAAKDSRFALSADALPSFVPVVVETAQTNKAAYERRPAVIEIVIGAIKVRVPGGANTRDVTAVLRAVRCSHA